MSSRIIRGDDRSRRLKVSSTVDIPTAGLSSHDHVMNVEKQAFEQGYQEGERIGKQMGEKMVEAVIRRYEASIVQLAQAHKELVEAMEEHTVRMALEISRKLVHRELTIDPDIVAALANVTLKRVHGHHAITLRVSRQDYAHVRDAIATVNPAVSVKEDAALERGDFVIDTSQTHLDVRVSSQVDTIGRALFDE